MGCTNSVILSGAKRSESAWLLTKSVSGGGSSVVLRTLRTCAVSAGSKCKEEGPLIKSLRSQRYELKRETCTGGAPIFQRDSRRMQLSNTLNDGKPKTS